MAVCHRLFVCCFLSIFCLYYVESTFPVAVFMWSRQSSLSQDFPSLAGHTLSSQDFQDKYLKNVLEKPQTVSLFVQDRLSVDDISRYGDAFTPGSYGSFNNLKAAMDAANSSISLPSVEASFNGLSSGTIGYIKSHIKGKLIHIQEEDLDSFSVEDQLLDSQVTNVLVFHLHPVQLSSQANAGLVFSQNDEVMASITQQIANVSPSYTCILMGDAPSKIIMTQQLEEEQTSLPHDRLRRDVADDAAKGSGSLTFANGTLFINGECIYMHMTGMTVKAGNQSASGINVLNTTSLKGTVKSECSNISASSVMVNFKTTGLDTTLSATFNRTKHDWYCTEVKVVVKGKVDGKKVNMDKTFPCAKAIQVPMYMSYHCYNTTFTFNKTDSVHFVNFQVQPYGIRKGKFSYAYDCVGFFSIPILMGLITLAVIIMILFFGVMAVFSITTMDRFDDPKGPGLSIGITQ